MKSMLKLAVIAIAIGGFAQAALADYDCSKFGHVKSKNSDTAATIIFVNKTAEMRSIIWIDFSGGTKLYKNLQPGQSYSQKTYLTHPWLVTDGPGNCYGIYVATAGTRTVNLTRSGAGGGD